MAKIILSLLTSAAIVAATNVGVGYTLNIEGRHTMYFGSTSSDCKIVDDVDEGAIYFKNRLAGESVKVYGNFDEKSFLSKMHARLVFEEIGENFRCGYYYSPKIRGYKSINGKKVNLHIAVTESGTTVGTPIIFGSY